MGDMKFHQSKGNTLGEYALLLGLLGVLVVSALQMLGFSVNNLLGASTQAPQRDAITNYYSNTLGAKVALTSAPVLTNSTGANGTSGSLSAESAVSTNVTSVEGNNRYTLGTLRLADGLDQMAQQATDPVIKAYYAQLAKLSYYMGANEGELDDFDSYSKGASYTNADALNDLLSSQAQLQALMNNPPAGVSQADLQKVLPFTQEVDRVASSYKSALQSVIGPAGKVVTQTDFIIKEAASPAKCSISTCQAMLLTPNPARTPSGITYDSLVPYEQLKAQVQTTLSNHPISADPPVMTTLQDATVTNSKSSTP
jgi:Flp pilus assembly pilin Flp